MNAKNKNELANVLNDGIEIFTDVMGIADLISKSARTAVRIIGAVRTIFDIPDEAVPFPEEPKKAAAPKKKKPAPKPEPVAEPEPEPEEAPAEKEYSKAEVRKYLAGVAEGHRAEIKALLTKYGADNLTQLDPTHYAAIMADAEEIADA